MLNRRNLRDSIEGVVSQWALKSNILIADMIEYLASRKNSMKKASAWGNVSYGPERRYPIGQCVG